MSMSLSERHSLTDQSNAECNEISLIGKTTGNDMYIHTKHILRAIKFILIRCSSLKNYVYKILTKYK